MPGKILQYQRGRCEDRVTCLSLTLLHGSHLLLISYKCKLTALCGHTAAASLLPTPIFLRLLQGVLFCLLTSTSIGVVVPTIHPHLLHACSGIRITFCFDYEVFLSEPDFDSVPSSCHRRRETPKQRRGLVVGTVLDGNASIEGSNISMS